MGSGLPCPLSVVVITTVGPSDGATSMWIEVTQPGDHLLGWCEGAFAEYVCADDSHFVPKPAELSFEAAATLAMAGCTALQRVRDVAGVQPGQEVLIIGAGGGVGTMMCAYLVPFHITQGPPLCGSVGKAAN